VNVWGERSRDVWTVATETGAAEPLLADAFTERDARVLPDGRWVAYVSDEAGRAEVSVRNLSGPPRRIVISGIGGEQPVWRRDGTDLFFVDPRGLLQSVPVRLTGDGNATFGLPETLAVPPIAAGYWGPQYDVSPDGRPVYLMRPTDESPPPEIAIVIGRALLQ
jgi:dipeptidyl aminopeptidase/acylaminoacyl peptidase